MEHLTRKKYYLPVLLCLYANCLLAQQSTDTIPELKSVEVSTAEKKNAFTTITPSQNIDRKTIELLNAPTAGDIAKYFSGVLIKDYGGAGGLKTISVRSLGANYTCVLYDGIAISDAQTGQIDLSRFSGSFIENISLQQGSINPILQPARAYALASSLNIFTKSFTKINNTKTKWDAGIEQGSYNFWKPKFSLITPLSNRTQLSFNAEYLNAKGNYPFTIKNGNITENAKRDNSDITSFHSEINLNTQFKDSSTLQFKTWTYNSERGLPGTVVFFNNRSVQRLQNDDWFTQLRYTKKINNKTRLIAAAKYNYSFTAYTDPDFLNNQGGINDRYTQQEYYATAAIERYINTIINTAFSSDVSYSTLNANKQNFASPERLTLWNNAAITIAKNNWNIQTNLLWNYITDKVKNGISTNDKNKILPAVAASIKPSKNSPFLYRVHYKHVFRMPTFNDLYYNFIGNTNLTPEFSKQINAGISYSKFYNKKIQNISVSADAYYNTIKDKIIAIPRQNLFVWTMMNIGKADIKGLDVNAEITGRMNENISWFTRVAYTLQNARDITNKSATNYKDKLPYTPIHSGSAIASINYKNWTAGYNILFSDSRYVLGENNPANKLKGWQTQDIYIIKKIAFKNIQSSIKIELNNLANQRYDVIRYYPMPGRNYKISIQFNNI